MDDKWYWGHATWVIAIVASSVAVIAHVRISHLENELQRRVEVQDARIVEMDRRTLDNVEFSLRCCSR